MLRNIRDGGRGQEPTVTKAYMGGGVPANLNFNAT
jgi:hypothetical protein